MDVKTALPAQPPKVRSLPPPEGLHEAVLLIVALGEKILASKTNGIANEGAGSKQHK